MLLKTVTYQNICIERQWVLSCEHLTMHLFTTFHSSACSKFTTMQHTGHRCFCFTDVTNILILTYQNTYKPLQAHGVNG